MKRSTVHHTFVIERTFSAPASQVYQSFADPKAKGRWFVGPDDWEKSDHRMDFRVGGSESVSGGPPGGPVHKFNAVYRDIVPNERIIYTYHMHADDRLISVSVATLELKPSGKGTKLTITEQGAYLDGIDNGSQRQRGTVELLDKLERALQDKVAV